MAEQKSRRAYKHERQATYSALVKAVATNKAALTLLSLSSDPRPRLEFTALLVSVLKSLDIPRPAGDIFSNFISWCRPVQAEVPAELRTILIQRHRDVEVRRQLHAELTAILHLKRLSEDEKQAWLSEHVREVLVDPLEEPYPKYHHWIAETPEIAEACAPWIKRGKQADKRHKRHPIVSERLDKIPNVVEAHESVIFRDRKTRKIVMVVIRNICNDTKVMQYADRVVGEAMDMRKGGRLEDQGKLVLLGYTAGARSQPLFDWSRNLQSQKHSADFIQAHDYRVSSIFALFWNLIQSHLPDEVLAPVESYLTKNGICRMDSNTKRLEKTGTYMVEWGDEYIEFNEAELAPPSGVAGCNYAREKQPQQWAFSWTTSRREGMVHGGNFYEAIYGVKVCQAPNTMVAWMPEHDHGTSLLDCGRGRVPKGGRDFDQAGIALVTSTRLAKTWHTYLADQDLVKATNEWMAEAEEDVDEFCGDPLYLHVVT
ncbi:uncharacterized protein C8Q71DRAFT_854263 [Rhodofomes roseus]|uniref:Uncharacterized protein n=1 Tax=Rhodofomes roseus TaxID=34475 RepID=A0ABQ8KTM5_9APHY|nr:uncharacterized protein C8Q71DRAFT_854263 [Rhodofomes roseus]KAH9841909.1 hypothetical protein C8Q71DRAFT_854263 [Rhodofomes roseus]